MKRSATKRMPPPICPVCGENVPPNAPACPACGADENTGWSDDHLDGINLPDDEFDYDNFIEEEFETSMKPKGISPLWWVVGILLVIAMILARVL